MRVFDVINDFRAFVQINNFWPTPQYASKLYIGRLAWPTWFCMAFHCCLDGSSSFERAEMLAGFYAHLCGQPTSAAPRVLGTSILEQRLLASGPRTPL